MPERTRYHHGRLAEALVEAARERLETHGEESVRLRELAATLGVSKSAPYRHYPDRDALLRAVMATGWRDLRRCLVAARESAPGARSGLIAMGRAYLRFAQEHPGLFRLLFSGRGLHLSGGPCAPDDDAFAPLVSQVAACQAAGWKTDLETLPLALAVWAQVHGAAQLLLEGFVPAAGAEQRLALWSGVVEAFLSASA